VGAVDKWHDVAGFKGAGTVGGGNGGGVFVGEAGDE